MILYSTAAQTLIHYELKRCTLYNVHGSRKECDMYTVHITFLSRPMMGRGGIEALLHQNGGIVNQISATSERLHTYTRMQGEEL